MYQFEEADRLWIRKARKGDAHAFASLYSKIYQDMYRFALGMMKHPQDAEDAVSETVLSAFRYMSTLKQEEAFGSWMFRILSNVCKKHLLERQKHRKYGVHMDEAEHTDGSGDPDTEKIVKIQKNAEVPGPEEMLLRHQEVRKAYLELAEEERLIVGLSVFGGYNSKEIGEILALNQATVRSKRSRALEKMRKSLEKEK